ncbi:MAG: DUF1080 domain-containing protein [Gemmataceae bacterium]|nr:DUF1080 domain-containing protein [Gemmataceae bacterium]
MRRQAVLWLVIAVALAAVLPLTAGEGKKEEGWRALFNGKDLTGWDTWLGRPAKGQEIVGLNKDPSNVYSVVMADGKPAVRISGEIWGALTTKEEHTNYHLKLEFKWGQKKWPPREKAVRDSGLLYHCVGKHGAQGSFWMQSQELQIQEGDCGDYWSVAGAIVDVEGEKTNKGLVYKKGGERFTAGRKGTSSRIIKSPDNEKPSGQWNTVELLTVGQTSVHVINGKVVMVLTGSRRPVGDKEVPLTAGKIQLQSEGAEVYYRNIALRPITKIPQEYLR